MNYPPPTLLHDARFLGRTFRERETGRRRRATLQRHVETVHRAERAMLIEWLAERFSHDVRAAVQASK